MSISAVSRFVRPVSMGLLLPLMIFLLNVPLFAQDAPARIEEARWEVSGDTAIITFNLVGDADLMYDVSITLTRESDKNFRISPVSVSGAIGKGKHVGARKEIRWQFKKDVPQGLAGDDYAFVINIQIIKEGGGSNLLYYLAGGAVVVGGAAVLLLSGSKASAGSTTSGLPGPPTSRPGSQ